ncbi:MaoC/PaaZ C-terminal domain-containing protein [Caldinitratiruptor microaerophilus]|nr:MaoC/PaaZ C-terminal domain-containing protein [Caldinitratiruptor microaerophilus]
MLTQRYVEDVAVGTALGPIEFGPVTTRHLVQWAAAANDFYEIHYDKAYALAQGLPDVVVHGPLKLALMGRLLMGWVGPQGWIRRLTCRYLGFDVPGTVLRCTGTVTAVRPESGEVDVELELTNSDGARTAAGTATVRLPRRGQGGRAPVPGDDSDAP